MNCGSRFGFSIHEGTGIAPELLEYHARAAELDWSDQEAILEYWVGAWALLSGSAHEFDPELIRKMAAEDLARTPNPLTAFNHVALDDAAGWIDRLEDITKATLIIYGTDDIVLLYTHAESLNKDLPYARLVRLDGVGHDLPSAVWPTILGEIHQHRNIGEQYST